MTDTMKTPLSHPDWQKLKQIHHNLKRDVEILKNYIDTFAIMDSLEKHVKDLGAVLGEE